MKIVPSPSQLLTVQPRSKAVPTRQLVTVPGNPTPQRPLLQTSVTQPGSHPGVQQYQQNASIDAELGKTIALLGVDTYV